MDGGAAIGDAMTDATLDICKSRRVQSLVDILASVMLAMLLWPFPVARAMLSPSAHIVGVLIACVVAQLVYFSVSASVWHRTFGMRIAGIRLESADDQPLTRVRGVQWGLISAAIALWYAIAPGSACAATLAERASRTKVTASA